MLTTYTIAELLQLKPPTWLIEHVIPEQGLVALYGQPGDGKSFIALDMALAAASGMDWQGHPCQKSYVVYISAEGGAGISKRVGAWLQHHHIEPVDYGYFLANFVVSAVSIHPDSEDLASVLQQTVDHPEYKELIAGGLDPDEDTPPLLIVVDTLARCFTGDENQQEDMGLFIRGLDALRDSYQATVLVVHHTGKHGPEERGSSAFRGACDAMMLVTRDEDKNIVLKCTKQKDYEEFPEEIYSLVMMPKWNSCIVESLSRRKDELEQKIQEYLVSHPNASIRETAEALGQSKSTIHRAIMKIRSTCPKEVKTANDS